MTPRFCIRSLRKLNSLLGCRWLSRVGIALGGLLATGAGSQGDEEPGNPEIGAVNGDLAGTKIGHGRLQD